jgi:hypothetical protein
MGPNQHEVPVRQPCDNHQEASGFRDFGDQKDGLGIGAAEGGTWGHDIDGIGFQKPGGTWDGASGGSLLEPGNR